MKKNKTATEWLKVWEQLVEVTIAICSKCKAESKLDGDAFQSADVFYENGWRATADNLYCKRCAKKHLK